MKNYKIIYSILSCLIVISTSYIHFSCKKKCINYGNGDVFDLELFDGNTRLNSNILNQIKFYYYQRGGSPDTLKFDPYLSEPNTVQTEHVIVGIEQSFSFLSFTKLNHSILENKIKDNTLYLKFPDGQTDTMKVYVRNKEGCDLSKTNFYIDSLLYNGVKAEQILKAKMKNYRTGADYNRFKVNIH